MVDRRTENQKVAAVAASMTMAGQPMSEETASEVRRIFRGETTADQSVLELLERRGYGDSGPAEVLRCRITDKDVDTILAENRARRARATD